MIPKMTSKQSVGIFKNCTYKVCILIPFPQVDLYYEIYDSKGFRVKMDHDKFKNKIKLH